VQVGVISHGRRKGQPKYSADRKSVVVTIAEEQAEHARFEAETGKCGDCKGEGKVLAGWHHVTGTSYRECVACHGSGMLASMEAHATD